MAKSLLQRAAPAHQLDEETRRQLDALFVDEEARRDGLLALLQAWIAEGPDTTDAEWQAFTCSFDADRPEQRKLFHA